MYRYVYKTQVGLIGNEDKRASREVLFVEDVFDFRTIRPTQNVWSSTDSNGNNKLMLLPKSSF